jgi:hypothetical protein
MISTAVPVAAEDKFADTNAGKAAKETLEAMANFLNDWTEISNLPMEKKIKVVQAKARQRIWDKMKEQQLGVAKKALEEYAKERLRQAIFQEASAKLVHQCVVEGKSVAQVWSAVDADMKSTLDTRMNALSHVIDAAEISYAAYQKLSEGKTSEALTDMGKAVAEKFLEYMIPGWGWYRLAQQLVEALGNWVMQYAFDTALEGKIREIAPHDPKTSPVEFGKWLLTIKDIKAFVSREWDEQIGYGGFYAKYDGDVKTDDAGEAMKNKIIEVLERMKNEALQKKQVEDQLRAKFEEQERNVADAARKIQEATQATMKQIEEALAPLKKYEEVVYGLRKQDMQVSVEKGQQAYQEVKRSIEEEVKEPVSYDPLDRGGIISAYRDMLEQVRPSFATGYDIDLMMEKRKTYDALRKQEIQKIRGQIINAEKNKAAIRTLAFQDDALLKAEERLVDAEAAERFALALKQLKPALAAIQAEIDLAEQNYQKEMAEFEQAKEKLNYPEHFERITEPDYSTGIYAPVNFDYPYDIPGLANSARLELERWKEDARRVSSIESLRARAINNYKQAYMGAEGRFKILVNEKSRDMGENNASSHVQSWQAKVYNYAGVEVDPSAYIVKLPWISFSDYKSRDLSGAYSKRVNYLEKRAAELQEVEPAAILAVRFWRIFPDDMIKYESEQLSRVDMEVLCERQGERYGLGVDPDQSDCAGFIEEMKEAWEAKKNIIMAMKKIRDDLTKIKFKFKYGDPRNDPRLDQYLKIPEIIAEYEAILAEAKAKRARLVEDLKENIETYQKDFKEYTGRIVDYRERMRLLQELRTKVETRVAKIGAKDGVPEEAKEVLGTLDKFAAMLDGYIKKMQTDISSGIYRQPGGEGSPVDLPDQLKASYVLNDVTLNDMRPGELQHRHVLTSLDLKNGKVVIKGELSTAEGVDSMTIVDGAGNQKKLKVNASFSYEFAPKMQTAYKPQLLVRDVLGKTITLDLFPQILEFRYEDIDFEKLVVESISALADSYEQQNIGVFSDLISNEYFASKSTLEEGARSDFASFADIRLKIAINRIERRNDMFVAETQWQRAQTVKKTGAKNESSGKTTFMFVYENGKMRVKNMKGGLIYASLSPEIAQANGLSQREIARVEQERDGGPVVVQKPAEKDPVAEDKRPGSEPEAPAVSSVEAGNFKLTQYSAHPGMPGFAESFDFGRKQVLKDNGFDPSGDFRRREGWIEAGSGARILDLGSRDLDSISEVPAGGYTTEVGAREGSVYAVQRADGTYAVVEFQSASGESVDLYEGRPISAQFRYRYQRNGSRNFQ